jgi:NAD(P)H-hydrate repair Nnr-like enzyme with NAD(P)H-hydrate dehydratase domain
MRAQNLVLAARPEVIVTDPLSPSIEMCRINAWVLGPGIAGGSAEESSVTVALATGLPAVVDAGAIDRCVMARIAGEGTTPADRLLLTPHIGELERALALAGSPATRSQIEADPATYALLLARIADATVLLKGSITLIATPDGSLWSQAEGPAWLATGGAGDVLAGICGVLLAAGMPADRAGALAALVHGRAATLASGGGPIAALDVADAMPATIETLREAIAGLRS